MKASPQHHTIVWRKEVIIHNDDHDDGDDGDANDDGDGGVDGDDGGDGGDGSGCILSSFLFQL